MKGKLIVLMIVVTLLLGSILIFSQNNSALKNQDDIDNDLNKSEIKADLPTKNKNIYLYRVEESRDVGGGGTSRQIGNTTYPTGAGYETDPSQLFYNDWFLYPTLAGDLTIDGTFSISIWANNEGTGSGSGPFICNLTEVKPNGDLVNVENYQASQTYQDPGQGWQLYEHSFDVNHTLEKGSNLKITLIMDPPSSVRLTPAYGGTVGGAMRDSNVTLPCQNYIQVDEIYTLDYNRNINSTFKPDASNKTMYIHANITDPFGGYDVEWTDLTLIDPDGTVVLDNITMEKTSGNFRSYVTEFETQWDYSGHPEGSYDIMVRAADKTALRNWESTGSFQDHEVYGSHSFYIGGLPYYVNLQIVDDQQNPLPDTTVVIRKDEGLFDTGVTDSNGITNISFAETTYDVNAVWEDIEVTGSTINITQNRSYSDPLQVTIDVFYPEIRIIDDKNNALGDARVYVTHPNGTTNTSAYITNENGRVQLVQVPKGNFEFSVEWKDKEVAEKQININSSDRYEIKSTVYHLHIQVKDNQGESLNDALVIFQYEDLGIVVSSKLTNQNGNVSTRLARADYNIEIYWKDSVVYDDTHLINSSTTKQLNAEVYHIDVNVYDTLDKSLEEAKLTAVYSPTGRTVTTTSTDANGSTTIRLASGEHRFLGSWKGIQVINKSMSISSNDDTLDFQASVYHLEIKAIDNTTDQGIISNSSVSVNIDGEVIDTGSTSANGIYTSRLPGAEVDITIYWRGIEVYTSKDVQVSGNEQFEARCDVYYLDVKTLDSRNDTIQNALINVYNNGEYITNGTTNVFGMEKVRLPVEDYTLTVDWKGVKVGEKTFNIEDKRDSNSVVVNCDVYYIDLKIKDQMNESLSEATIESYLDGNIMFSYQSDENGNLTFRLPSETFTLVTNWKDIEVNETIVSLTKDQQLTIHTSVYHVDLRPLDSHNNTINNAQIEIFYDNKSYSSGRTNDQGILSIMIPEEVYRLRAEWQGVEIYESHKNISDNGLLNFTTEVYYLTLSGVDVQDKTVNNMAVSVYHGSLMEGQDLMTTVDIEEEKSIRVPAGDIELSAQWRGFKVAEDTVDVTGDSQDILACEIYYLDISVVDSEDKYLDGANLILKDNKGEVFTTAATEEGAAASRLPTEDWEINVYWNEEMVGQETVQSLTSQSEIKITTDVHYIRLKIKGNEGGIKGVQVTLMDKNSVSLMTNKTSSNGSIVFSQVPEGDYSIKANLKKTQLMTDIDKEKTKNVTLDSSQDIEIKFNDYPKPVYTTNLFFSILLAIAVMAVGSVLVARKKEVI